jgi:hypothetical protein
MANEMYCNICNQIVKIRKQSSMGAFPVQHERYYGGDFCHGFFVASNKFPEKDDK